MNKKRSLKLQKDLHDSILENDIHFVEQILKTGLDLNYLRPRKREYIETTPLMLACEEQNLGIVKLLLRHGANPNIVDQKHRPALYYAIQCPDHALALALVTELIDSRASVHHIIGEEIGGINLLVAAVRKGHYSISKLMIDMGVEFKANSTMSQIPIIVAASYGHLTICELLIDRGENVNLVSKGMTPIVGAASCGEANCVEYLLRNRADPNLGIVRKDTALISAARECFCAENQEAGSRYVRIIRLLLEAGASVEARADFGWTALDFLADDEDPHREPRPTPQWVLEARELLRKHGCISVRKSQGS